MEVLQILIQLLRCLGVDKNYTPYDDIVLQINYFSS